MGVRPRRLRPFLPEVARTPHLFSSFYRARTVHEDSEGLGIGVKLGCEWRLPSIFDFLPARPRFDPRWFPTHGGAGVVEVRISGGGRR